MRDEVWHRPIVLSLEGTNAQPLSIRAKALVFTDPVSCRLLTLIERLAPSEAPVMIIGETGTGKELVARHIHQLSGRKGPFLAVNCGAINDQLAESELFGHEAGSFTGATGRREGWFEAAQGGTLFLDEIGDLPLHLQVKLLRVLQEREVVRIGSRKPIPVDVRFVAATNVDLDAAVNAGHFRRDLLYRINIAQVHLPPLRERPGDILPLANHFIKQYSKRMNIGTAHLTSDAREALLSYAWPGNIRELENVIHFALLVAETSEVRPEHLKVKGGWGAEKQPSRHWQEPLPNVVTSTEVRADPLADIARLLSIAFEQGQPDLFESFESLVVQEAFRYTRQNQVHSAALLGVTRNVMRTMLKRHGLLADGAEKGESKDDWRMVEG
ncbi:sigma-54 interaction domain-containing protein [Aquirhabdus parva]|uniref:Sigma-54-dependent Fis family transcriptional regulator n=1 Tax=Aquirhabdus parva TaxID=2283318 RepID=A0A345P4X6_9GAMM|nr:sigma-54-dependent Fis family transcriptional regulator [Aquirhabdus parva]